MLKFFLIQNQILNLQSAQFFRNESLIIYPYQNIYHYFIFQSAFFGNYKQNSRVKLAKKSQFNTTNKIQVNTFNPLKFNNLNSLFSWRKMTSNTKPSLIQNKKEQFRKQLRNEQLKKYMKKIRTQFNDSQQYSMLKRVLDSTFQQNLDSKSSTGEHQKMTKLEELIKYANFGQSPAIIQLSDLLLHNRISIQMIEQIACNFPQNSQNSNPLNGKTFEKKDMMKIIQFPAKQNEGWLAFIRVLVQKGYCTENMIFYCLKTVIETKSIMALDFAIQIVHILVVQKKLVKIQQIVTLLLAESKAELDKDQNGQKKLYISQFFHNLMKFSLNSALYEENAEIKYFSTKLLLKFFYNSAIMDQVFLKLVHLSQVSSYLTERFNMLSQSLWSKTKATKMMSQLLICLTDFNHFSLDNIMQILERPFLEITQFTLKTSYDLFLKKTHMIGYNLQRQSQMALNIKDYQQNFKFIQQAINLIEIITDDYLSTHNDLNVMNNLMQKFHVDYILIYLHGAYIQEVHQLRKGEESNFFANQQEGLTLEEMCKCLLVEKVQTIMEYVLKQFREMDQKINSSSIQFSLQARETFQLNRIILFSRLKQSSLSFLV